MNLSRLFGMTTTVQKPFLNFWPLGLGIDEGLGLMITCWACIVSAIPTNG